MIKDLRSLLVVCMLCVLFLSSCDKEAPVPYDPLSTNAVITQLKGDWLCTYVEENVYINDTGEVLRVSEGESNDTFTFANTYYQKKSSPHRYFVYGASKTGNGKTYLHLEEYDSNYYTLEVTSLNNNTMAWKITFEGSNSKAIKLMYFKR